MKLLRPMLVLLAFSLGQPALAATYSFTGLSSVPSSGYSTTNGGITVTVTTPGGNHLTTGGGGFFGGGNAGLGSNAAALGSAAIDSGESLLVSFSQDVTVGSISLGSWGFGDSASVTTNTGSSLNMSSGILGGGSSFDLSSLGPMSSLTLTGKGVVFVSQFYLGGLSNVQAAAPSAVPLPASAWLFMSALFGLVAKRRLSRR